MKIYHYDEKTKEFIVESEATESPLEKGVYLIPANATNIKPLVLKDGFAICFKENKKWEYQEDNRDKTVYSTKDKTSSKVDYLGSIKEGFTLLKPNDEFDKWNGSSWEVDKQAKKENYIIELSQQRDEELNSIIINNILINEKIINTMQVELNATEDNEKIEWIDKDNKIVKFTKAQFEALIKKGILKIKAIYFKYRKLKDDLG